MSEGVTHRISREKGWLMMIFALVLDILPLLGLIGAFVVFFTMVAGTSCGDTAVGLAQGGVSGYTKAGMNAIQCVFAGGVASLGSAILGPGIFFLSTIVTFVLAIAIFPIWFAFNNYWMVSLHPKKTLVNFISYVTTTIWKLFPILNFFPLPLYTLTVWAHLRIARMEDEERAQKKRAGVEDEIFFA
jgi:hypothetical protein